MMDSDKISSIENNQATRGESLSTTQLLRGYLRDGNERDFERFYGRYFKKLHDRGIFRFRLDPNHAENLVQETFIRLIGQVERWRTEHNLAVSDTEGELLLWRALGARTEPGLITNGHAGSFLAFSSDGRRFLEASTDIGLSWRDPQNGEALGSALALTQAMDGLFVGEKDHIMVSQSRGGPFTLNFVTRQHIQPFPQLTGQEVVHWTLANRESTLVCHTGSQLWQLAVNPSKDDQVNDIAVAKIQVQHLEDDTQSNSVPNAECLALAQRGNRILYRDAQQRIWVSTTDFREPPIELQCDNPITRVCFSCYGRSVAGVTENEQLLIWDATDGQIVCEFFCPLTNPTQLSLYRGLPDLSSTLLNTIFDNLCLNHLSTAQGKVIGSPAGEDDDEPVPEVRDETLAVRNQRQELIEDARRLIYADVEPAVHAHQQARTGTERKKTEARLHKRQQEAEEQWEIFSGIMLGMTESEIGEAMGLTHAQVVYQKRKALVKIEALLTP